MRMCNPLFGFLCFVHFAGVSLFAKPVVRVASKQFTESYLLAEVIAQVIEREGELQVDRKLGMGGNTIIYEGLKKKEIDFYVEYTGTLSQALLKDDSLDSAKSIRQRLEQEGLTISDSLGFNNTYAIAMEDKVAQKLGIKKISDLRSHPSLRAGWTPGFLNREDGYPNLKQHYGLELQSVRPIAHGLKIDALLSGDIGLTDLYQTDAVIAIHPVRVLHDDLKAFSDYHAVILTRLDLVHQYPKTWSALKTLEGSLSEKKMASLNGQVELEKKTFAQVASAFLGTSNLSPPPHYLVKLTLEHLLLVSVSVVLAIVVGIPLALYSRFHPRWGGVILLFTGMIQTIPSLALLCFLIPFFGIGKVPAIIALFLYALLPIVRSTYTGLVDISPALLEMGKTLGMNPLQQLWWVELPLASRHMMSGIKTSAIISVGTATLAALIGAGGYGDPILAGLGTYNVQLIISGALPAALLALIVHGLFELLDRVVVPKGLRL